jgi:hypothetical protein
MWNHNKNETTSLRFTINVHNHFTSTCAESFYTLMKTTPPHHVKPSIATQDIEMEDNEFVVLSKPRRQRSYSSSSLSLSSAISWSSFSKASWMYNHDCYINSTIQDYNYNDTVHKKQQQQQQQELSAATEQEDQLYCQEDHHDGDDDDDSKNSENMKQQHHHHHQQQHYQRRLYQNLRRIKRRLFLEQVTQ